MSQSTYAPSFALLVKRLGEFLVEFEKKDPSLMATDEWTVKDILCHLVFWHENYAANYNALANSEEPPLFDKPTYLLNTQGVKSLRKLPVSLLVERLHKANNILKTCIVDNNVPRMTYKKRGRVYDTADFIEMVAGHFKTHTIHVRRAK